MSAAWRWRWSPLPPACWQAIPPARCWALSRTPGAGFGAAFGPLILLALMWHGKEGYGMTGAGALAGLVTGAGVVGAWIALGWNTAFLGGPGLYEIVPGFAAAMLAIIVVSKATQKKTADGVTRRPACPKPVTSGPRRPYYPPHPPDGRRVPASCIFLPEVFFDAAFRIFPRRYRCAAGGGPFRHRPRRDRRRLAGL